MNYSTWDSTPQTSFSVTPNLSLSPKYIRFEVCVIHRDRNHTKCVNILETKTLKELKWMITDTLNSNINSSDICLTMLDADKCTWRPIPEEKPHIRIVDSSLIPNSILNVERGQQIKTIEKNKLTLKLCERSMRRSSHIVLIADSATTLGELKAQAKGKVTDQRTDRLSLWANDDWTTFEAELDDVSLAELGFENYSIISFQSKDTAVPGVCGLTNLGSTCFMNSVFQCLSNIPCLTQKILSLDNKMNAPIISSYSQLIKTLWSGEHFFTAPSSLLCNVSQSLPHFTRYRQHDAHEFMNHFLHLIHQELTNERTFITDLFYGQLRSTVQCLGGCHSSEINQEKMSFLPLPIDDDVNQHKLLYLRSNGEHQFVSVRGNVKTTGELIQSFIDQYDAKLSPKQIKAVRIGDNYITKEYSSTAQLFSTDKHQITLIEVPEKTVEQRYIELQFHGRKTYKPFRPPIFLVCPLYGCHYSDLFEQIERIQDHFRSTIATPNITFHFSWINTSNTRHDLNAEKTSKYPMSFMDRLVMEIDPNWVQQYTDRYSFEQSSDNVSLTSLLADFFREEPLTGDYYCAQCEGLKQAKQKADLTLPLPCVLIIQLKRFTFDAHSKDKIDTYINFPIRNLDLGTYVAQDDQSDTKTKLLYDLVAVSNHSGNLASGHYTTYARNDRTNSWYSFNDEITREITDERDVVTKNAYILVYVQQTKS